jgi:hypothetical protein
MAALPERAPATPKRTRKLLIFDLNVIYPGHPSRFYANLAFQEMGKKTGAFDVVISRDPAVFEKENLAEFDAVFLNNTVGNLFEDPALRQSLVEFVYGGGGLLSELDQLDPARIFAFHLDDLEDVPKEDITDARRLIPGLGVVPLGEICGRLKAIGYDGACSVELFRPEYWAWDPTRLAIQVREAALEILSPYFEVE